MIGTQEWEQSKSYRQFLKKYTGIQSLMTFDNDALLVRRIMFTLGEEFNDGELETLLKDLEDHGFRVVYVEEMKNPREVETIVTYKSHLNYIVGWLLYVTCIKLFENNDRIMRL